MAGMDLGKQIGPLPLGAWVAVVAGGLGIALWSRNNGQSEDPEIVEDVSGDEGVGEGPGWIAVPPPSTNPSDGIKYESNEAWGQAAINWLTAQGYHPGISNSAITKALNGGQDYEGKKMSIQEWALWTLALTKFGSPPYPVNVSPPTSVPGPVTPSPGPGPITKPPIIKPPAPKPGSPRGIPPHTAVIAKSGDTISKIAARYGKGWREVWDFNLRYRSRATAAIMRSRGPNLIFNGTRIWVPK